VFWPFRISFLNNFWIRIYYYFIDQLHDHIRSSTNQVPFWMFHSIPENIITLFHFDTLVQILSITNLYVLLFIFYLPPTRLSTNRPFAHSHTNTDQLLNLSTSMPVEEINLIFKQMLCSIYWLVMHWCHKSTICL